MYRKAGKIELPHDFAEQLLDCEIQMKLSSPPSKETIVKLIQLYTMGVEYYESKRNHKYMYFQLKLQQFLTSFQQSKGHHPYIDDKKVKMEKTEINEQDKIRSLKIKERKKQMKRKLSRVDQINIQNILEECEEKDNKTLEKVKVCLGDQQKKFNQKLTRRKSRYIFTKSSSTTETNESLFSQKNGPPKISLPFEFKHIIKENEEDEL